MMNNNAEKNNYDGEELANHLEGMAAHVINSSIHEESTSTEGRDINIAQLESKTSPTCFLAQLLDSIAAHSSSA